MGAWRGMSPDLDPCCGGDGVASADVASLQEKPGIGRVLQVVRAPDWRSDNP